jgi:hypothetical protein
VPTGAVYRVNRSYIVFSGKKRETGKIREIWTVTGTESGKAVSRPNLRFPYFIRNNPVCIPVSDWPKYVLGPNTCSVLGPTKTPNTLAGRRMQSCARVRGCAAAALDPWDLG